MTTELEISTVAAVKSVQTLRQQTAALTGVLKELTRTIGTLQSKMKGGGGAKELAASQRKATNDGRLLSRELIKQKNAAAAADVKFKGLTQRLNAAGATKLQIKNLTRSFDAFQKKMKSATLTTRQFSSAMNRWKASGGTANRVLFNLKRNAIAGAVGVKGLSSTLRNLGSSAVFAVGPLSGIGARVTAFSAISARTGIKIAALTLGVVALGVAIFKTAAAMVRVSIEINKINNALKAAVGSAEGATKEFQFLVDTSRELSLDLSAVGLQFAQLSAAARGTSLAGSGVRKIFKAVSTAALVLGLGADQAAGALRAIQQMMSKGTVQAEELRGQLGERIPGAFQIAARAMKVTTRELGKMLEQGTVLAEDLLPKMAEELEKTFDPQVEDAVEQIGAAIQRLKTEFFLFFALLEKNTGLVQGLANILNTMSRGVEVLNNAMSGDGLQGQLDDVNKALEENTEKTTRVTRLLKAASGAWLSAEGNIRSYKDQILALTFESIRLTEEQRRLQDQLNAQGDVFGPPAPSLTFDQLRNLPVASVDKLKDSLRGMRGVLESLADPSISLEGKLGIVVAFENAGKASTKVAKILKGLSKNELTALRTRVDGSLRSMEELRTTLIKLVTRFTEAKDKIKETTKELTAQERALKKVQEGIQQLTFQVEGLERLNVATLAGKVARDEMLLQLEIEARLRRDNVSALSAEGEALAALLRRKMEAINVAKTLREEEEKTLRAAKRVEELRDKIAKSKVSGADELASIEKANEILRMRIQGLNEEADAQELRNQLEKQYSGRFLEATRQKLFEVIMANRELQKSLEAVNEVKQVLSDGFKQLGSDLASGIREGKNLVDVLTNSFATLLETLLDLAIQLLIIKPLLASLNLPGGDTGTGAAILGSFGLPSNLLGLPSAKGNVFQGGNVVPFAKGGILNEPTTFGLNNGKTGIAGEAGTEGILPLKRGSSGNLGVEASGMGAPIVQFFLAPGTNLREFNEAQPQIAATIAGTLASASASNG